MKTNKFTTLFKFIFFTVSIMDILGILLNNSLLQTIFKPMIILSLLGLYFFSTSSKNYWYILALAFSFLGDVLLMDKSNLFLFGIAAFLFTQIFYIKIIWTQIRDSNFYQKTISIIPFLVYLSVLLFMLIDNLKALLIPVIVYGVTISVFGMVALLNYITDKNKNTQFLFIGAILFISSDSMIALNKFHQTNFFYSVAIMITYVLAQYLIYCFMVGGEKLKAQQ